MINKEIALSIFEEGKTHVIPVNKDKTPATSWKQYQEKQTTADVERIFARPSWGIAMLTGVGGLEVIDFDSDDWEEEGVLHHLWAKEVTGISGFSFKNVALTPSGGMHYFYRCELIEGNQKLARSASKKVVIETRGVGGYVVVAPSAGYTPADPFEIPTIRLRERDILLNEARKFDRYVEPEVQIKRTTAPIIQLSGLTPIDDYNNKSDLYTIIHLLEVRGWKAVKESSTHVYMRRPGKLAGSHSADIVKSQNLFKVWSSNAQPFEMEKAYSAFGVYAMLVHNNDYSAASKELYKQGYGDRATPSLATPLDHPPLVSEPLTTEPLQTAIEVDLSRTDDDIEYTMFFHDHGKDTPIAGPGSVIVITGDTGSGKSTIQDLMSISALVGQPMLGLKVVPEGLVVRFDTEQEMFWLKIGKRRILDACNYDTDKDRLKYYSIESIQKTADKERYIEQYLTEYGKDVSILFIDNIVDLVGKVNDEEASLAFVNKWKHLAKEYGFILVLTLHETRSSGMAQGWLGKIMEQRSAWTIRMVKKKNETGEYFVAENRKKRGKPFEAISFQRGQNGEINSVMSERRSNKYNLI